MRVEHDVIAEKEPTQPHTRTHQSAIRCAWHWSTKSPSVNAFFSLIHIITISLWSTALNAYAITRFWQVDPMIWCVCVCGFFSSFPFRWIVTFTIFAHTHAWVKNMKSTYNIKSPSLYHIWTKCSMRIRNGLMISQFLFIRFLFLFFSFFVFNIRISTRIQKYLLYAWIFHQVSFNFDGCASHCVAQNVQEQRHIYQLLKSRSVVVFFLSLSLHHHVPQNSFRVYSTYALELD